ncbi:MAG: polynucleotide adenylyltransferase PcnB [Candidatus Dadabacteria bacterium]|nr:MAG: polynucleotide adenylyltransferase PcnB [Candidatus Dadabacteria bacterium]
MPRPIPGRAWSVPAGHGRLQKWHAHLTEPRIYSAEEHGIDAARIDPDAARVVRRLKEHGYDAYIVGGAVRDLLLGRKPKDFDVATSATPDQIRKTFRNSRIIGRRFQIAHVFFRNRKIIEVSTFRREPKKGEPEVEQANNEWGTAEDDARRRDLTINAFFLDPDDATVVDYIDGMADLEARTVRIIGDPTERFIEDPIRMIRAIRHAARTGFLIEPETWDSICANRALIAECNESRIRQEFVREFQEGAAARSVKLLWRSGLLEYLLPEYHEFLEHLHSRPEQKRTYWKLLRLLDREGAEQDLPATLIFATALGPAIVPELLAVFQEDADMRIELLQDQILPYLRAVGIPKALAEPLSQTLYAQPRLDRARRNGQVPKRLRSKSYFGLAMHLFLLRHQAIGSMIPESWQENAPPPEDLREHRDAARSSRRRGRGGRGNRGNKAQEAAPSSEAAPPPDNAPTDDKPKRSRRRRRRPRKRSSSEQS